MSDELIKELASIGFFDETILTEQSALMNSVTSRVYEAGDVIFQYGEDSKVLYIIRQGLVKLLSFLPNGRTRIVRMHKRGSLIGLNGLMENSHEHTAVAVEEVSVYQIPHTELIRWRETEPLLYSQLMEKWYEYLSYADTWITDFSTGNIKGRVARLVRFLARFETGTGPRIVELLTTDEMSDILGVTPESVSRVVAEFKREGILKPIENNPEALFSCDMEKIEQVSSD